MFFQVCVAGGAGCISATANINPHAIHTLFKEWESNKAVHLQKQLNQIRNIMESYPMIPALKSVVAYYSQNVNWETVRPPLVSLKKATQKELIQKLADLHFDMS